MPHLARVGEGMDGHDCRMNDAGPDGEPDETQVTDWVTRGKQEKDAERGIDTENHVKVRRLLRLPRPAARPEAVQREDAEDEYEAEDDEHRPQKGGGGLGGHGVPPRRGTGWGGPRAGGAGTPGPGGPAPAHAPPGGRAVHCRGPPA